MRILLTGVTGMLGSDLWPALEKAGHELIGTDLNKPAFVPEDQWKELDITDQKKTFHVVSRCNPDIIIHAAAYTDVDGCEKNSSAAYKVNGLGTRNLLLGAQRFDSVFLYISTDQVFGKDIQKQYVEIDNPAPVMQYARSKYMGEMFVRMLSQKYYIVRTSWLFGKSRKNYVLRIADCLRKNNKTYSVADDMIASPTYSVDLAEAISFLIEQGTYGLYHITNSGYASRYEVAGEIADMLKLKLEPFIKKVSLKDLNLPAKRPKSSIIENHVWQLNGYKNLRHWKEAVKELITGA